MFDFVQILNFFLSTQFRVSQSEFAARGLEHSARESAAEESCFGDEYSMVARLLLRGGIVCKKKIESATRLATLKNKTTEAGDRHEPKDIALTKVVEGGPGGFETRHYNNGEHYFSSLPHLFKKYQNCVRAGFKCLGVFSPRMSNSCRDLPMGQFKATAPRGHREPVPLLLAGQLQKCWHCSLEETHEHPEASG